MNMIFIVFGIILFFWLAIISYILSQTVRHYSQLTMGMSKLGLRDILERILQEKKKIGERVTDLETFTGKLKQDGETHFQKIGIVRFNPFSDTGGSQSFALALLDDHDNGIVITSLYARTGNRWYVKEVRGSKGVSIDLSKEEEKAIRQAESYEKENHE